MQSLQWKPTYIFPFEYLVSNDGKVYSIRTKKLLSPSRDKYGYIYYVLCVEGKRKTVKAHRLVALSFIDNPENKNTVDHINGIRTDNRVENLEWVTSSDNQKHKFENTDYKTSNRKVVQMDLDGNEIAIFDSVVAAAKAMNASRQGIDKVCKGTYQRKTAHGFLWKYLD